MSEPVSGSTPDATVSVVVLPHQSLSRTGLAGFLAAQSLAAGLRAPELRSFIHTGCGWCQDADADGRTGCCSDRMDVKWKLGNF